nr:cellulose synthase-like protein E1 isoform X1 [Malus domestica]
MMQLKQMKQKICLSLFMFLEKRPSHPHHFKAGALNVLLRVSGVISNSPYILGLDCDMYCNDASSARQAMCFHLDPKISPSLAFVQFPHKFHNISINDIYDSQLRSIFTLQWQGYDGLGGPCVCGSYYIKRVALCGSSISEDGDAMKLRQCFGPSKQFIKSLRQINKPDHMFIPRNNAQLNESPRLASCAYEDGTKWGKEEVTEPSIPLMLMVISYSYLWHASWFLIRFSGGRLLHRVSFALQRLDFSVL